MEKANGEKVNLKQAKAKPAKPEAAKPVIEAVKPENVGMVESINAMIAELTDQNNGLRNRAVQLAGELARAKAIISTREATIRDLNALMTTKKN